MRVPRLGVVCGLTWFPRMGCWIVGRSSKILEKSSIPCALRATQPGFGGFCLRALTRHEAEDYRRAGVVGNVAIVPNGVTIPTEATSELLFEKLPGLRSRRIVLYLGRLHRGSTCFARRGRELLLNSRTQSS